MIAKNRPTGGEKMQNEIKVSQLGNCTDLWNSLKYNHLPKCTFGGFSVNLHTIKKDRQDTAVLSSALSTLFNQFCTITDQSQNPLYLTIGELYDANTNVDVIFDPLSTSNLSWDRLSSSAARLEKFSDTASHEQLTRLEIQLLLQADAELQRKLKKRLTAKQQEYQKGWTHFHKRIEDFWTIASEVCLGKKTDLDLYSPTQADWFDSLYFANIDNKSSYVDYIYSTYEDETQSEYSLSKKIDLLRRKLNAFAKHIQKQNIEIDQKQWRATFMAFIKDISTMWYALWPTSTVRKDFNCPVAEHFLQSMNKVESMIQDSSSSHSLFVVLNEVSPDKQIDTIQTIRKLLGIALKEWKHLISQRNGRDDHHTISTKDSLNSTANIETPEQHEQSLEILKPKSNETEEFVISELLPSSTKTPDTQDNISPAAGLSVFIQELASFAAKEFMSQTIAKGISQFLAAQESVSGESSQDSSTTFPLLEEKKK